MAVPFGPILQATFSPDGKKVVATSVEGKAYGWAIEEAMHKWADGKRETPPDFSLSGHEGALTGIAFAPTGTLVITASTDGTARIWDTREVPKADMATDKKAKLVEMLSQAGPTSDREAAASSAAR